MIRVQNQKVSNVARSQMRREIEQIPEAADWLLSNAGPSIKHAASALPDLDPAALTTIARGSSDHAAAYFKYIAELLVGLPVASMGPSVASVF